MGDGGVPLRASPPERFQVGDMLAFLWAVVPARVHRHRIFPGGAAREQPEVEVQGVPGGGERGHALDGQVHAGVPVPARVQQGAVDADDMVLAVLARGGQHVDQASVPHHEEPLVAAGVGLGWVHVGLTRHPFPELDGVHASDTLDVRSLIEGVHDLQVSVGPGIPVVLMPVQGNRQVRDRRGTGRRNAAFEFMPVPVAEGSGGHF